MDRPTREDAWKILCENVKSEALRRHALAVEAVMRHAARKRGEDEEAWGAVGLVHDVDYERFPEEHLSHAAAILGDSGWPEDYVRAVVSHGPGRAVGPDRNGVEIQSNHTPVKHSNGRRALRVARLQFLCQGVTVKTFP